MIEWMLVYVMIDVLGNNKANAYTHLKSHESCIELKYQLNKSKDLMIRGRTVRIEMWCQEVKGHHIHPRRLTR
jgi:hypothetical protein